jgi:hypothetical protein
MRLYDTAITIGNGARFCKYGLMQQMFKEILSQKPAERKVMAEFMRSFGQANPQSK